MNKKITLLICVVMLIALVSMTFAGCESIFVIDNIVISTLPSNVHYSLGDSVSLDGMVVTVNYANGRSSTLDNDQLTVSTTELGGQSTDSTTLGTSGPNAVTVEYHGYTDSFSVVVLPEADIYVDTNNGHDILSGDSAVKAKKTLAAALSIAEEGDVICFVDGEHTLTSSLYDIVISKSVTLIGSNATLIMSGSRIVIDADNVVLAGLDIVFATDLAEGDSYITVDGDNFLMYSNNISVSNSSTTANTYNVVSLTSYDATITHNSFDAVSADNFVVMDSSSTEKQYVITYNTFAGNATAISMGLAHYNIDNNTFDLTLSTSNVAVEYVIGSYRYGVDGNAYDNTFNNNTINGAYAVLSYSADCADATIYWYHVPQIVGNKVMDGCRNFVLMFVQNDTCNLLAGETAYYPIDISNNSYDSNAMLLNKVLYQYCPSQGASTTNTTSATTLASWGVENAPVVVTTVVGE